MSHWQDFCIELHHCCLESQASPSFSFSQLISVRCQLLGTGLHISPTNLPSSLFAVRCCQMLIHYLSTHLGQFLATHPPQYFLLSSTEISLCQLICCQLIISVSCSQLVSPSYFLFIVSWNQLLSTYLGQLLSTGVPIISNFSCQLKSALSTYLLSTYYLSQLPATGVHFLPTRTLPYFWQTARHLEKGTFPFFVSG